MTYDEIMETINKNRKERYRALYIHDGKGANEELIEQTCVKDGKFKNVVSAVYNKFCEEQGEHDKWKTDHKKSDIPEEKANRFINEYYFHKSRSSFTLYEIIELIIITSDSKYGIVLEYDDVTNMFRRFESSRISKIGSKDEDTTGKINTGEARFIDESLILDFLSYADSELKRRSIENGLTDDYKHFVKHINNICTIFSTKNKIEKYIYKTCNYLNFKQQVTDNIFFGLLEFDSIYKTEGANAKCEYKKEANILSRMLDTDETVNYCAESISMYHTFLLSEAMQLKIYELIRCIYLRYYNALCDYLKETPDIHQYIHKLNESDNTIVKICIERLDSLINEING